MNYRFSLIRYLRSTFLILLWLFIIHHAKAQEQMKGVELYGYIKTDIGYNFDQIDPNWFDVLRVTKLPQYYNQFAPDGKIFFSMRETKLGFNGWTPTPLGQLKLNFEFDLFGVGLDEGQTKFHFRKAYAALGNFTVGQTESLFTDAEASPIILDFGAPPGRVFIRNIQIRYTRTQEDSRWAVALEEPGATSDEGIYADRIELQNVKSAFKLPDLTAEYRRGMKNGHIEMAGVLKWINWENTVSSPIDLSGEEIGWGFYISSKQQINLKTILKGQIVYGRGIESHLTDADVDVGIKHNFSDPTRPLLGVALPVIGGMAFVEHQWTDKWASTAGYSILRVYNAEAQAPSAFKEGHYVIVNMLHRPFSTFLMGAELQWGKRNNFSDGFSSSAVKLQFSFKYNFSHTFLQSSE